MVTWPSLGGLSEVPGAGTRPVGCREGSVGGGLIFFFPEPGGGTTWAEGGAGESNIDRVLRVRPVSHAGEGGEGC